MQYAVQPGDQNNAQGQKGSSWASIPLLPSNVTHSFLQPTDHPSVESRHQDQGCHFQVGSKWIYQDTAQGTSTGDFTNTAKVLVIDK